MRIVFYMFFAVLIIANYIVITIIFDKSERTQVVREPQKCYIIFGDSPKFEIQSCLFETEKGSMSFTVDGTKMQITGIETK